ncbi:MAG: DNA mismatch repair protein MutS [Deltaproteobacteria bacterium]|nr:DNA mismatch repair protein MutS [Deltaproteobacteria bacterium]
MTPDKPTPMIQQYLSVKDDYPDALLFYRMGDFYEMFFEDAEKASRILNITLTSRNKNVASPIPMCGVPYKAAKTYISRLIAQGYKVAICDQVEDPAKAKGLVKREVTRVVTPGTILEDDLLDAKSHNYIMAIDIRESFIGLAYLDISTGKFSVTETREFTDALEEALRVSPSEILLSADVETHPRYPGLNARLEGHYLTFLDQRDFEYGGARQRLLEMFNTLSLEGFGCEKLRAGVCAAGALVAYVQDTQKQSVAHIQNIETYVLGQYLLFDERSYQNLEIERNLRNGGPRGTLLGVIDKTLTAMGGRQLREWVRYPLIDPVKIGVRHDAVQESVEKLPATHTLRGHLKRVQDIERLQGKIAMGHANARDLSALKNSLQALPEINAILDNFLTLSYLPGLKLDVLDDLADLIEASIRDDARPTIQEGGIIKPGYNAELDELIQISRDGKGWLVKLEARERETTGITTLKVRYNKVFGYYLEVPKARLEKVPQHYVRKQTLVNAERYITDELKTFESRVLGAEDRRAELEYRLFQEIRQRIMDRKDDIQAIAKFLARVDCLTALAVVAEENAYSRPELNADGHILINDGRHPVVEKMITGERFVPNSVCLDDDQQVLIITGPNMAGKSTILRQVALTALMAQTGSFVPAGHASLGITDRIFTRVGALDNLSQGHSTFLVEMQETANILNNATPNSLVIMDEIGRGTSTYDGLSIAWAVAEYLHDLKGKGVKTLFATHYHELTELSQTKIRVKNYNIAVKEWNDEIIFLRKLVAGGTNRSYGIQVARLAGIPAKVISKAKKILNRIENAEHEPAGDFSGTRQGETGDRRQVQLELFSPPEREIIKKIKRLDISTMTPIEALNHLHDLKAEVSSN